MKKAVDSFKRDLQKFLGPAMPVDVYLVDGESVDFYLQHSWYDEAIDLQGDPQVDVYLRKQTKDGTTRGHPAEVHAGPSDGESLEPGTHLLVEEPLLLAKLEVEAQQDYLAAGLVPEVDVLKVPHHGSRYQDPAFLRATAPKPVPTVATRSLYNEPTYHPVGSMSARERSDNPGVRR